MRYSTSIAVLTVLLVSLTLAYSSVAGAAPSISLIPSADTVSQQETVTLSVRIDVNGTGSTLGAYSFELEWNPDECSLLSVEGGDVPFANVNWNLLSAEQGTLLFNQFSVTGATGIVYIAHISFQILASHGASVGWNLSIRSLTAIADEGFADLSAGATITDGQVSVFSTRQINGFVRDINTSQPISQVSVILSPGNHSAVTNSSGMFSFANIPADDTMYTLTANVDGYRSFVSIFTVPYHQNPLEITILMAYTTTPIVDMVHLVPATYQVSGEHEEIYVTASAEITAEQGLTITSAEAFIGDDPGLGNGVALSAVDGQFDESAEEVTGTLDLSGLPGETHNISVRARNSAANWGDAASVTFVKGYEIAPPVQVTWFPVESGPPRSIEVSWELSASEHNGGVSWYRVFRSRLTTFGPVLMGSDIDTVEELHQLEQQAVVLIDSVAAGNTTYMDEDIPPDVSYYTYWIQATGNGGGSPLIRAELPVAVTEEQPSAWYVQVYPNPFNPRTVIRYDVDSAGQLRIDVYGVTGALVRTLVDSYLAPGIHEVVWDGRDSSGNPVASGLYVYCLSARNVRTRGKMLLVK